MDFPVVSYKNPYFNFLREVWLDNEGSGKSSETLLQEAAQAWAMLDENDKMFFEEEAYIVARKELNRGEYLEFKKQLTRAKTSTRNSPGSTSAQARAERRRATRATVATVATITEPELMIIPSRVERVKKNLSDLTVRQVAAILIAIFLLLAYLFY